MFDFFSNQLLAMVGTRRSGGPEGVMMEARRLRDLEVPLVPVARAAGAEDQVLLGAAVPGPTAPLPVKPNEPCETGNRVGDVLRRLRESRRKAASKVSRRSGDPPENASDDPSTGGRLDRWA